MRAWWLLPFLLLSSGAALAADAWLLYGLIDQIDLHSAPLWLGLAAALHKKTTGPAISSGTPTRRRGVTFDHVA